MKKLLSILLAFTMIFALTACGENSANGVINEEVGANGEVSSEASTDESAVPDEELFAESTANEEGDSCDANIAVGELTVEQVMNAPVANWEEFVTFEDEDGTAWIGNYEGTNKILVIPEEADGRKVTVAGGHAFSANGQFIAVKFPDTLKEIEEYAFSMDENLEIVICGSDLETIGKNAFFQCTSLREVVLNDGLKEIKDSAFWKCDNLKSITVPESVEVIEGFALWIDNEDFVIKGKAGSVAEAYAKEHEMKFEAIE